MPSRFHKSKHRLHNENIQMLHEKMGWCDVIKWDHFLELFYSNKECMTSDHWPYMFSLGQELCPVLIVPNVEDWAVPSEYLEHSNCWGIIILGILPSSSPKFMMKVPLPAIITPVSMPKQSPICLDLKFLKWSLLGDIVAEHTNHEKVRIKVKMQTVVGYIGYMMESLWIHVGWMFCIVNGHAYCLLKRAHNLK